MDSQTQSVSLMYWKSISMAQLPGRFPSKQLRCERARVKRAWPGDQNLGISGAVFNIKGTSRKRPQTEFLTHET